MSRTTIRAIRDKHDNTMFRLPNLNRCVNDEFIHYNSILVIHKHDGDGLFSSLVETSTENILIPSMRNKLTKGYIYVFKSILKDKIDPELSYQYEEKMVLHSIEGCDDEGFLWCERMLCTELYKLVGKDLYNSILEKELNYGKVYRF